jgi:glycosyltransferase involved in cell wall biosynthesis
MKILFLSHKFYPMIGGIEVISEMLADAFADAGHEVHLLTWMPDESNKVFKYKVTRSPGILTLLQAHAWANVVFENNICLRLSWPAIFFNSVSVIALHTWVARVQNQAGLTEYLKFFWLKRSKKVIAVSQALRIESWKAATVVGNPYRASEFITMPEVTRNKAFLFLGRLVSDKGVDLALLALHKLRKLSLTRQEATNYTLTIIGEGEELGKLKLLATELDLLNDVTFLGSLTGEKLIRTLNEHQIMLVPSRWQEPFGVVVLEGMACGCIPIVSDSGGLRDAVGNAGLIFKNGDVDDMVDKMDQLIKDAALREELRMLSKEHLSNFHPNKIISQYLEAVESSQNI